MADRTKSKDWNNGFVAGCNHAKGNIWGAVYDYVHRHHPERADQLKAAIVAAMTEKSNRERDAEQSPT